MSGFKFSWLQGLLIAVVLPFVQSEATSFDADLGPEAAVRNVILMTWDGVRTQEFLGRPDPDLADGDDADILPWFWDELAPRGRIYGDERHGAPMTVANTVMMSLPGYQSVFAGRTQPCFDNYCERLEEETFMSRIVQKLALNKNEVASIASWYAMKFAVVNRKGEVMVNAGLESLDDGSIDEFQQDLNVEQSENRPPWPGARYDRYTFAHALHYLRKNKPRFLHIGLNDSDEWGHRGHYPNYLATLRQYDRWLKDLFKTLEKAGDYGRNTCIILTTDHGRGKGNQWSKHSNGVLESGLVWMYAGCPFLAGKVMFEPREYLTTHLDVRPTVEALMGIRPRICIGCGTSLVSRRPDSRGEVAQPTDMVRSDNQRLFEFDTE